MHAEIGDVDRYIDTSDVGVFLSERKTARTLLSRQRDAITTLEVRLAKQNLKSGKLSVSRFSRRETAKLAAAQLSFDVVGPIAFSHCPACGKEILSPSVEGQCHVCKENLDPDIEKARYNQIRLDLEIQSRETNQLLRQKNGSLNEKLAEIRKNEASTSATLRSIK